MLCTCETQGTQHMISMQKLKFSSLPRAEFSLRRLENEEDPGVVSRSWGQEHSLQPPVAFISYFYYSFGF